MTLARSLLAALVVLTLFVGTGVATPVDSSGDASGADGETGPPDDLDLPGPVPGFVEGLLQAIGGFLGGAIDGILGPAVSDPAGTVAPNGG